MSAELTQIFLEGCNAIADIIAEPKFKRLNKGRTLKKVSDNKDLTFKISFETSFYNTVDFIKIKPQIAVFSKKVRKWERENLFNYLNKGMIYYASYEDTYPCVRDWNLSEMNGYESIENVADLIRKSAFPIFELFEDTDKVIKFLIENGTQFDRFTSQKTLVPLNFLLCYGLKDDAERFFNRFIDSCSDAYRTKIIALYKELETEEEIEFHNIGLQDGPFIRVAFVNGLKINAK